MVIYVLIYVCIYLVICFSVRLRGLPGLPPQPHGGRGGAAGRGGYRGLVPGTDGDWPASPGGTEHPGEPVHAGDRRRAERASQVPREVASFLPEHR